MHHVLLDLSIAMWNTEYMDQLAQTTTPQPATPPQTPSSHRNIVPLVIVAVIAALLASFGTYFVMSSNQKKQLQMTYQPSPSQPTPTEFPISTKPTATVIENGWKVYTDSTGRFTLKYKDGWYVPSATVNKKATNETLKTWLASEDARYRQDPQCTGCYKIFSEKETTVDGHQGVVREVSVHPAGRTLGVYILLDDDEIIYLNTCCGDPDQSFPPERHQQFEQILSSFKFIKEAGFKLLVQQFVNNLKGSFEFKYLSWSTV